MKNCYFQRFLEILIVVECWPYGLERSGGRDYFLNSLRMLNIYMILTLLINIKRV
jgi:hypothetical protein